MLGVLAFGLGASVGSFLNVVADRLPRGQSLVMPRSHCPSCGRTLGAVENVPVLSYLWLRARCRWCRARIPLRVMLVEAVTGVLFVLLYLRWGLGLSFAITGSATSVLLALALIDLDHRLILNRIVLPSALGLLVLAPFWTDLGESRSFLGSETMLASALNSLVAGFGAFLFFYAIAFLFRGMRDVTGDKGGLGGGDIKLAGLIGLLVGFPGVVVALWVAVVAGGLVAASLLALGKKGRKDAIPFGPFLSLGAITVLLAGGEIVSGYERVVERTVEVFR